MTRSAGTSSYSKYNYLSAPDEKLKCFICLDVAEEPQKEVNCHKLFCRVCIKEYEEEEEDGETKDCPNCQKQLDYFSDESSSQEISWIPVRCENADNGCLWTGTRETLEDHVTKECDFIILVVCKYHYIGCKEPVSRKRIRDHEDDSARHLQLALATIKTMKERLHSMKGFTFKIPQFSKNKKDKTTVVSEDFYSDQGYKMHVAVQFNCQLDNDIEVVVFTSKGPNDGRLSWPFKGKIRYRVLNQLSDDGHFSKEIECCGDGDGDDDDDDDDDDDLGQLDKPTSTTVFSVARSDLMCDKKIRHIKDDTLYFNVRVLENEHWLKCT